MPFLTFTTLCVRLSKHSVFKTNVVLLLCIAFSRGHRSKFICSCFLIYVDSWKKLQNMLSWIRTYFWIRENAGMKFWLYNLIKNGDFLILKYIFYFYNLDKGCFHAYNINRAQFVSKTFAFGIHLLYDFELIIHFHIYKKSFQIRPFSRRPLLKKNGN